MQHGDALRRRLSIQATSPMGTSRNRRPGGTATTSTPRPRPRPPTKKVERRLLLDPERTRRGCGCNPQGQNGQSNPRAGLSGERGHVQRLLHGRRRPAQQLAHRLWHRSGHQAGEGIDFENRRAARPGAHRGRHRRRSTLGTRSSERPRHTRPRCLHRHAGRHRRPAQRRHQLQRQCADASRRHRCAVFRDKRFGSRIFRFRPCYAGTNRVKTAA